MPRVAMPEPTSHRADYNERNTGAYTACLQAVGLEPVIIPTQASPVEVATIVSGCQGVLLPGSPADVDPQKYGREKQPETAAADPLRDNLDEMLLQDAFNLHKPVFGICYGLQILNVWRTGTLLQHLPSESVNHEAGAKMLQAHGIVLEPATRLALLATVRVVDDAVGATVWVNSSHHQAVECPGDGLLVSARSEKDGVIEALEGAAPDHWILAVQWHPERTFASEPLSRALFEDFARAVNAWKPRAVTESVAAR